MMPLLVDFVTAETDAEFLNLNTQSLPLNLKVINCT